MTDYERELRRGLASVRRVYRRADSLGEILERTLRRLSQRKTVPRKVSEVDTLVKEFRAYQTQVANLEAALARDYVALIR